MTDVQISYIPVPLDQTFTARICHALFTVKNHPIISDDLNLFKPKVSYYLSYISSWYASLTLSLCTLTMTKFSKPLPWMVLGLGIGWTKVKKKYHSVSAAVYLGLPQTSLLSWEIKTYSDGGCTLLPAEILLVFAILLSCVGPQGNKNKMSKVKKLK